MPRCQQSIHSPTSLMPVSSMLFMQYINQGIGGGTGAEILELGVDWVSWYVEFHPFSLHPSRATRSVHSLLSRLIHVPPMQFVRQQTHQCVQLHHYQAALCAPACLSGPLSFPPPHQTRLGSSLLPSPSPPYPPCCILPLPRGFVAWFCGCNRRRNATGARLVCAHDG